MVDISLNLYGYYMNLHLLNWSVSIAKLNFGNGNLSVRKRYQNKPNKTACLS